MAYIYPTQISKIDASYAEREVYKALENLSDDYFIFHSLDWTNKKKHTNFIWYENDFVILHKKFGILYLEVKGGRIYSREGLLHQENLITKEDKTLSEGNDPIKQAKRGIYHFRYILEKQIPGITERLVIEPAIFFPSCLKGEKEQYPLVYQEAYEAILDSSNIRSIDIAIYNIFNDFYKCQNKTNISDDEFEQIKNIIASQIDLIPSPNIVKGSLEDAFIRLTNEQASLLDYISEQKTATIQGAAGTGKTIIAVKASERFASERKKVLFLCFNKFLYEHLKENNINQNVSYYNINSFVSLFTKKNILDPKKRCEELCKLKIENIDYDDIIIDEAQDFEDDEINFFKSYTEIKEGRLLLFYDKNQIVITNKIPSWIKESECKLLLTKNCRNTYEIALTSYNVIDAEIKQKYSDIHGNVPTITFAKNNTLKQLGDIINYYKSATEGYQNNEITILSLKSEEFSILKDITKISGNNITRIKDDKSILFTTAKKFKGLENKVIIIIDIDEYSFHDGDKKRVFYVACSRAKHRLSLLIEGDDKKIEKISSAIEGNAFSPKGKIMMKTKTKEFNNNVK